MHTYNDIFDTSFNSIGIVISNLHISHYGYIWVCTFRKKLLALMLSFFIVFY